VVASVARSLGALTIGVVTRPFGFEGKRRAAQADLGIERLREEVDTLIVIPNDRLLSISDRHVSVLDAFKAADQVLLSGVQGITDLITTPGLINLDFADVKSVMSGAGSALMGIGSARGDDRSVAAAEMAISSPLLEASIDGAHGVLLSIQGGSDLGLFEINEAAQLVSNSAAPDANIIFGAVIDDALGDEVRVTVIAAGFDEAQLARSRPGRAGGLGLPAAPAAAPATALGTPPRPQPDCGPSDCGGWRPVGLPDQPASAPLTSQDGDTGGWSGSASAASASTGSASTGSASTGAPSGDDAEAVPPPRPADPAGRAGGPGSGSGNAASGNGAAAGDAPAARAEPPAARAFEGASTRRRSVVFEEDDDLDVPDFLK
jgi:cell division protein FtsZ